jgi:hypothetical protein
MLTENLAKIADVIKAAFHRTSVSDKESLMSSFSAALTR